MSLSTTNPYSFGRGSNDPNWDYIFKTYVKEINEDSYLTSGDFATALALKANLASPTFSSDLIVNELTLGRGTGDLIYNTALGYESLKSNAGESNTAIGYQTLKSNLSGGNNTAIGYNSLGSNTSGSENTASGNNSLGFNTSGGGNTASGNNSLAQNITGRYNSAFGAQSLENTTNGENNTAIGVAAIDAITTGSNNAVLGAFAGRYIADGSTYNTIINNSVLIGAETKPNADNETNQIVIGYQAIGTGSNTIQLGNTAITAVNTSGSLTAASYIKSGGTADQFLMANGSVSTSLSATYDGNSMTLSDAHSGSIIYLNADSNNLFNENLSPGFNCTIINYSSESITIVVHEPNYFYFPRELSTDLTIPAGGTVNIYALMIGDSRRYYVK